MSPRPDEPSGPQEPRGPEEPSDAAEPTGPEPQPEPEPDPDAAFRAIVAGFGRPSESPVPPWPVEEDVDEPRRRASDREGDRRPPARPPLPPPADDLPGWVEPPALEDGHHYVPPPPPPAPRVRPRTLAAAAAIALGVLLLFAPSLLDVAPGPGTSFLGMLLAGGGAGALVYWMRDAPGTEDGPDDGAVV